MTIIESPLAGLIIFEPNVFHDERGYFYESFQNERYAQLGIPPCVQDNITRSKRHVLRGLHYQLPNAQGKFISVIRGEVWDVVVDIRVNSSTFGQWFGITLNDVNHIHMFIPPGFAHGFCVLSEEADFSYKCTSYYSPNSERGIAWNDKSLAISWPVHTPILSAKDTIYPALQEISHEQLFA